MLRRTGGSAVTSTSPMRMRPALTCSSPAISRSVVDLPQPEGPSKTASVPTPTSNERSEEHTSELQSPCNLVCRLLLEKKKKSNTRMTTSVYELTHDVEACHSA